ncbi:hypothetical protein OBBRIDRAFT_808035 [Obba rivulosa]|uniref:Uncharacterized protein n=1 Tax=Obba rivulosa TaxID=1052685 RepID=A0A8E2AML8_9APHY|nr:hypothetical protein OBBRIDRAFT_808035 [Obba rivulosa]
MLSAGSPWISSDSNSDVDHRVRGFGAATQVENAPQQPLKNSATTNIAHSNGEVNTDVDVKRQDGGKFTDRCGLSGVSGKPVSESDLWLSWLRAHRAVTWPGGWLTSLGPPAWDVTGWLIGGLSEDGAVSAGLWGGWSLFPGLEQGAFRVICETPKEPHLAIDELFDFFGDQ